jgi:hypothetical protein
MIISILLLLLSISTLSLAVLFFLSFVKILSLWGVLLILGWIANNILGYGASRGYYLRAYGAINLEDRIICWFSAIAGPLMLFVIVTEISMNGSKIFFSFRDPLYVGKKETKERSLQLAKTAEEKEAIKAEFRYWRGGKD